MTTHSSVLAWRIPGTGEPGGLPSMGSHRVGHDWNDLAAAASETCMEGDSTPAKISKSRIQMLEMVRWFPSGKSIVLMIKSVFKWWQDWEYESSEGFSHLTVISFHTAKTTEPGCHLWDSKEILGELHLLALFGVPPRSSLCRPLLHAVPFLRDVPNPHCCLLFHLPNSCSPFQVSSAATLS